LKIVVGGEGAGGEFGGARLAGLAGFAASRRAGSGR
jgi:hypothetical protein